jgi:hypothetical protein
MNIDVHFGARENLSDNKVGPDDYTRFILFNACPTANFSFRFLTHMHREQKAFQKEDEEEERRNREREKRDKITIDISIYI